MIAVGTTATLEVTEKVPAGLILADEEEEVLLPKRWMPKGVSVGDHLEVFIYTDSEDRMVATTQKPLAQVGEFACLKVVDRSRHGAFLDWGLDKDLFVPSDLQHRQLQQGQMVVVAVFLDERTERVAAASKLGRFFDYDVSEVQVDAPVELLVHGITDLGVHVLVDGRHSGMVHTNDVIRRPEIGDRLQGFVAGVRLDNKLDIRFQRTGAKLRDDASGVILAALEQAGGELPLGDKSDPEEIRERLGLSKKAFKAAVGQLYKAGKVQPAPTQLKLLVGDEGEPD